MAEQDVKISPLGKRIVVKPVEFEDTTASGLIIPPTAQDEAKPEEGIVVKLGTGEKDFDFSVKVGDKVFFKSYAPDSIEINEDTFYILSEEDVLAIIG